MILLPFSKYQDEQSIYALKGRLIELCVIPKNSFIKAAVYAAKMVHDLIRPQDLQLYVQTIETTEEYLRGEANPEDCLIIAKRCLEADGANGMYGIETAAYAAFAAAHNTTDYSNYSVYAIRSASNFNNNIASNPFKTPKLPVVKAADLLRSAIPWNFVCAAQIIAATGQPEQLTRINQLSKNTQLIDYATVILSEEGLREEFEFLMNQYLQNDT